MLEKLAENLPVIVFRLDINGTFTYINEFVRNYGYEPEELIGQPISSYIEPEDLITLKKVLESRQGGDFSLKKNQYRFFDSKGLHLDLEVRTLMVSEEDNGGFTIINSPEELTSNSVVTLGLAWDVTSHVRTEEVLSAILNSNPNGMIVYNSNGTVVRSNQEVHELLGHPRDTVVGMSIFDYIHPDDHNKIVSRVPELVKGNSLPPIDVRVLNAENNYVLVEAKPSPVVIGEDNYVLVSFIDIQKKRADEKKLIDREEKYRAIFENSYDAILLMRGYEFIECNQKTLEMFRCEREDIVGATPFDISPEFQDHLNMVSEEAAKEKIDNSISGKIPYFEWKHQRKDGTLFDAEVNLNGIEIGGEHLTMAIVRDITKRKSAENNFRIFFENSPLAVVIVDSNYSVKTVNQKFCELFDRNYEELVGQSIEVENNKLKKAPMEDIITDSVWSGEIQSGSFRKIFESKTGKKVYGNVKLTRITIDNAPHLMVTIEDISELETAYDELNYRSRIEKFLGNIASQFITMPLNEIPRVMDEALREIAEMTKVDLAYIVLLDEFETTYSVIHLWASERLPVFKKEEYQNLPIEYIAKWVDKLKIDHVVTVEDFEKLDKSFNMIKKRMADRKIKSAIDIPMIYEKKFIGYIGFSNAEVREWKEDEVQLLRFAASVFSAAIMRERIQEQKENLTRQLYQAQKMEEVGRLTGGIAHDFNNLLTVILGNLDLLKLFMDTKEESKDISEEVSNLLDEMQLSTESAANLTKQLLVYSRTSVIEPKLFNPNESMINIKKLIARIMPSNVVKQYEISQDEMYVEMDPTHLQQIILNLTINAVDAMPEGGKLKFKTSKTTLNQVNGDNCVICKSPIRGEYFKFEISDTGHGISANELSKIFEPFYTTKEVGKGTGLGLATVTNILKNSNGHAQIESVLEEGSTFIIYLPLVEKPEHILEIEKSDLEGMLKGEGDIVVVEDNPNVLKMLSASLEASGFKVLTFLNAVEALDHCKTTDCKPKLVITDYIMPGMNGLEFIMRIREKNPEIKVLLMSGYTGTLNIQEKVLNLNIPFLEKPFARSDILRKIKELFD